MLVGKMQFLISIDKVHYRSQQVGPKSPIFEGVAVTTDMILCDGTPLSIVWHMKHLRALRIAVFITSPKCTKQKQKGSQRSQ